MSEANVYPTPEEAALAEWRAVPHAAARVVSVAVVGTRAEAIVELEPSYREWVYCRRTSEGWTVERSGNGPTVGWRDL